jgi:hypothetical protein
MSILAIWWVLAEGLASGGASFSARGGESIMYASVGSQAAGATKGAELYPIAGAVTFIMSVLCPMYIRKAFAFADWVGKNAPLYAVYGAGVISRTFNKMVMPGGGLFKLSRPLLLSFIAFMVSVLAVAIAPGPAKVAPYLAAITVCVVIWNMLRKDLRGVVEKVDYSNLGMMKGMEGATVSYVSTVVCLGLLMVIHMALMYSIFWPSVAVIALAYILWFLHLMHLSYHGTCDSARLREIRERNSQPPVTFEFEKPQYNFRQRWKDF